MRRINEFINEKLKVSSKYIIPTIEQFINVFDKYFDISESFAFWLPELDSIGKVKASDPNSIVKLPKYKIIGTENFLNLADNNFFKYPEDIIYLYYIELVYLEDDKYLFTIHYIPKEGLNRDNIKTRRNFAVYPEDLINVLGEDIFIETYEYLEHYKKN